MADSQNEGVEKKSPLSYLLRLRDALLPAAREAKAFFKRSLALWVERG